MEMELEWEPEDTRKVEVIEKGKSKRRGRSMNIEDCDILKTLLCLWKTMIW